MTNFKLIDDWKRGWKFISVHCMILSQAVLGAWMALPDEMKTAVKIEYVASAAIALLVMGTVGRFVDQGDGTK